MGVGIDRVRARAGEKTSAVRDAAGEYIGPVARKKCELQDDKVIRGGVIGESAVSACAVKGRIASNQNKVRNSVAGPDAEPMKLPPKRVGELAELAFLQKAMGMGYLVSKPWGDSDRYDFVADWEGKLYRVQVRSTQRRMGARGYAVHGSVYAGKKIVGLKKKDIDVLVAYIFPKNLWYVVPVEDFVPRKNLWFYLDGSKKGAKFEKFREAWGLMQSGRAGKK